MTMLPMHEERETIELQQKLARVQSLLEASRQVHSTIRLDEVLESVLEIATKELEAHGAFFSASEVLRDVKQTVYGKVPDDWTRWTESDEPPGYASAPLTGQRGEVLTHLVVYRTEPLRLEELDFLEGLALQSALAVGNAQHHERTLEWERVKIDLDAARAIQRSLLPQSTPNIEGYSLAFRSITCYEVGGDYVDMLPLPDGRLMIVLADVAGKGLASALMSMSFRSAFRAMAGTGLPLAEMAERMNTLHWMEGQEARRRYVTAVIGCLNPVDNLIEIVNAGHNPAFLCADGKPSVMIGASGPPLGMLPGRTYASETYLIEPGTRFLLYTDGLTEVFHKDEEFGEERLLGLVEMETGGASSTFLDKVWRTLTQFADTPRQSDDMTALSIIRDRDACTGPPTGSVVRANGKNEGGA